MKARIQCDNTSVCSEKITFNHDFMLIKIIFIFLALRYNWHKCCISLKYPMWWFDIYVYCEMITAFKLVNTSITLPSYNFCVHAENFWDVLSEQLSYICITVLLPIVIVLYIISPEPIYIISRSLYFHPFFHYAPLVPDNHQSTLFLWAEFFRFHM